MGATSDYIAKDRLKTLAKRSDLWGIWLCIHVWGVIAAAMGAFIIAPNPITYILAFLIIGSRQHGLAILAHDCAHGVLFKTKALNEWAGQYVLAAPYGGDMKLYRKYHLKHHRFTQSEKDPDLALSQKFPITRQSLYRKLFRDISGQTFFRLRLAQLKNNAKSAAIDGSEAFENNSLRPFLITNFCLFLILALLGQPWLYLTLWLLPLMTWFFAVLRLRNISEHAMTSFDDNPLTHARTTYTHIFEKIFLGPYWVNYHVEHHAYMYVPCYRLKALHRAMLAAGHGKEMEIKSGYNAVLKSAIKAA